LHFEKPAIGSIEPETVAGVQSELSATKKTVSDAASTSTATSSDDKAQKWKKQSGDLRAAMRASREVARRCAKYCAACPAAVRLQTEVHSSEAPVSAEFFGGCLLGDMAMQ
jgi:hypothetical protein